MVKIEENFRFHVRFWFTYNNKQWKSLGQPLPEQKFAVASDEIQTLPQVYRIHPCTSSRQSLGALQCKWTLPQLESSFWVLGYTFCDRKL